MVIGLHKRLVGAALLLALPFTGCGKQDSAAGSGNSGGSGSFSVKPKAEPLSLGRHLTKRFINA